MNLIDEIKCTGRDKKERTFFIYSSQDNFVNKEWVFIVKTDPDDRSEEFFELKLQTITDDTAKIIGIYTHDKGKYGQKGIPDILIPKVSEITGKKICSSSNRNSESNNIYRTNDATKMWERLVEKNIAFYNPDKDTYFLK